MSISAMKQALEALEKLADETPTTHVRAGKAQIEGKEVVALWFDDCSDPIQQAIYINATKPSKLKEFLGQVRGHLRQAIAEAEKQEPVAVKHMMDWVYQLKRFSNDGRYMNIASGLSAGACYELAVEIEQFIKTAPPKREWVGLTEEEIWAEGADNEIDVYFARAIEAKLKEKNT